MVLFDYSNCMELLQLKRFYREHSRPFPRPVPAYLKRYVEQTKRIKRFDDPLYPPGVIIDYVFSHSDRMRWLNPFGDVVDITVILHDIPELGHPDPLLGAHADMTAYEKFRDPEKAKRKGLEEAQFARDHFTPDHFALYQDYNLAADYLRGNHNNITAVTPAAIVAKVLDAQDGHIIFHRALSKWAGSPSFLPQLLPPDDGLLRGLQANRRSVERLREYCSAVSQDSITFIATVTAWVKEMWLESDLPYVPPVIEDFFRDYRPYK